MAVYQLVYLDRDIRAHINVKTRRPICPTCRRPMFIIVTAQREPRTTCSSCGLSRRVYIAAPPYTMRHWVQL